MARIYIRRYPRNRDYWEVMSGKTSKGRHLLKRDANAQAKALRAVRDKRKKR